MSAVFGPLVASIPSPELSEIALGPLTVHVYGILIALGVALGAMVTVRRYRNFGFDATNLDSIIMWTVIIGFLGARAAYVSTHLSRFSERWYAVFFVWEGGLALFGGITFGTIAAVVLLRRRGANVWAFADAVAIGLPLAQGIGRWGNYFNQELFGTPSTLPWAVEIAPQYRPDAYLDAATFHPTFLYESLWNLLVVIPVILLLEHRNVLRRGSSMAVYLITYGIIRFATELIRTDTTFRLLGLSRNGWVSVAIIIGGAVLLRWRQRVGAPQIEPAEADDASSDATVDGAAGGV